MRREDEKEKVEAWKEEKLYYLRTNKIGRKETRREEKEEKVETEEGQKLDSLRTNKVGRKKRRMRR